MSIPTMPLTPKGYKDRAIYRSDGTLDADQFCKGLASYLVAEFRIAEKDEVWMHVQQYEDDDSKTRFRAHLFEKDG